MGRRAMNAKQRGFTLLELLVIAGLVSFGALILVPALARMPGNPKALLCRTNLKQLTAAWAMYASDHGGTLVASSSGVTGRPNWMTGLIDFSPANTSNYDVTRDITVSPLAGYLGQRWTLVKCPADLSAVVVGAVKKPRVRSVSMNHAFGQGEWLDGAYNPYQTVWRVYGKVAEVMVPARTFVFVDEHPQSINDAAFAVNCTGASQPSTARIIDFPASYHADGACGFSFADGRAETHKWLSNPMKPPVGSSDPLSLNVASPAAWVDLAWLAQNTTVRR